MKSLLEKMVFGNFEVSLNGKSFFNLNPLLPRGLSGCYSQGFMVKGAAIVDQHVYFFLGGCCNGYVVEGSIRNEDEFCLYLINQLPLTRGVKGMIPIFEEGGGSPRGIIIWGEGMERELDGFWVISSVTKTRLPTFFPSQHCKITDPKRILSLEPVLEWAQEALLVPMDLELSKSIVELGGYYRFIR